MRLFLAGLLTVLAGAISDGAHSAVVVIVGLLMVGAAVYQHQLQLDAIHAHSAAQNAAEPPAAVSAVQTPKRERIVRERWRESRERYWPFER